MNKKIKPTSVDNNVIFGVLAPKTDLRDYQIKAGATNVTNFQLDDLPTVKNQSSVCSCAAHSSSSVLEWFNTKETGEYRELSVGFIYGMQGVEFNRMGTGMYLRDVCKIIQKYGDCLRDTVSFNIEMPKCYERLKECLNDDVYQEASICRVDSYARCSTDDAIKYALMKYSPVLGSIKWYNKYTISRDGVINFDTKSKSGYHAVMVYGFNEKGWLCQNSWGKLWGNQGRFILPYEHGLREAWSFVDAKNSDVYKPKRNTVFDYIYKFLNFVINLLNKN
jgi:C1A family cysteine protease